MAARKVVLIVLDGLTPAMFERAVESGRAPALAFLAGHGRYGRAVSTFPSLTPVCLSSIATGAHPDVHRIPHLVWYHRGERRFVEYGSSFGAIVAASLRRSVLDTIFRLNSKHLGADALTIYESVEDAGLVPAAINITCYRGRTWHRPTLPGVPGAWAPRRFFFYSLFESDETGAPLAVRNRAGGSVDGYATQVGRWLVTRDGFDFLAFYLSDYDYHSHVLGPNGAMDVLARCDASIGALMDAAGGWEEFLERYAVVLCSDHGQTRVDRIVQLEESYADLRLFRRRGNAASADVAVTASNRAAQVYRLPSCRESVRSLAERLDREAGAQIVLFREGGEAVARRDGEELRFSPGSASGDLSILDHPNAHERAWAALANPNAGEILVSAAEGCEFADLGGRHHLGGGSHGSLVAGDSVVPVVTVGVEHDPVSITDLAPLCLAHLGVAPPAYARPPVRATA